jgi:hypothetical protein
LCYHPQSVLKLFGIELLKSFIKRIGGRREALPSLADFRSRGLVASFDCSDAKRDLDWRPVAERAEFIRRGILVHAEAA